MCFTSLNGKSCFRVTAVVIVVVFWRAGSAFAFNGNGSGTEANPYVITNVYQLQEMQEELDAHYILGNDIDASGTVGWNDGAGFEPVGAQTGESAGRFTGTFDGKGYWIDGLYIKRMESGKQGLFGLLYSATVKNVLLINVRVAGDNYCGTLAGQAACESVVRRCAATGSLELKPGSGDSKSGGLVGVVSSGSLIDQCAADVDVKAGNRMQVGGLVGYLVGRDGHPPRTEVSNSYSPVSVLSNSYSVGTVTGGGAKQGNLVGDADASRVDRCYSCGDDKALIGFNFKNPVIANCYWDKDEGASSSSRGGVGKTTDQMTQYATFVDWDFDEIWAIDEGQSYPYFKWAIR